MPGMQRMLAVAFVVTCGCATSKEAIPQEESISLDSINDDGMAVSIEDGVLTSDGSGLHTYYIPIDHPMNTMTITYRGGPMSLDLSRKGPDGIALALSWTIVEKAAEWTTSTFELDDYDFATITPRLAFQISEIATSR